jgi:hypothetical protein
MQHVGSWQISDLALVPSPKMEREDLEIDWEMENEIRLEIIFYFNKY